MHNQEMLRRYNSLSSGLWGFSGGIRQETIRYPRETVSRLITDEEYQRLKFIEENQVNVQEYENTIQELEEIINTQNEVIEALSNELF
jgi:pantothenate kinase